MTTVPERYRRADRQMDDLLYYTAHSKNPQHYNTIQYNTYNNLYRAQSRV